MVAARLGGEGHAVLEPRPATDGELLAVHDEPYVRDVLATAGRPVAFDPDTVTSRASVEVARLAAGAACLAVERVLDGAAPVAAALVRPPGHHAERNRAMGFCLFNNIAVAAQLARARGAGRVAIVDIDVHHGNGTQQAFEEDPAVLFVSTHQSPFYPGTGEVTEVGRGRGAGCSVNVPIEAGARDEDYRRVYERVVLPVVRQFRPDLLLVSAGFDAHEADPLAGMQVTTGGFGVLGALLGSLARDTCGGRVVAVTEGGYNLAALGGSLRAFLLGLDGAPAGTGAGGPAPRGDAAVARARPMLAPYWQL